MKRILIIAAICICFLGLAQISPAGVEWTLKKQISTDSAPVDVALSPDGKWMFVLTREEVVIYEAGADKIVNRIPLEGAFDTISYSSSDNTLLVASRSGKAIKLIGIETFHTFSMTGLPFKGPEDAAVTIAVFSDYQCPYCARIEPLLGQLLDKYPKDLKVVFKNFPLSMHPFAHKAAMAALAAHRQGKFWEFHHKLFESASSLSDGRIQEIAKDLGLDMERFNKDLNDQELQTLISRDFNEGRKAEVQGTPTLFVNGKPVKSRSQEEFQQMIEKEMKKRGTAKAAQPGGVSIAGTIAPIIAMKADGAADPVKVGIVEPGDAADIQYLCRLSTGEVVSATETEAENEPKSRIFRPRKETGPLPVVAVRPDEPLDVQTETSFETEILNRFARSIVGMKEAEKRRVELTAENVPKRDEKSYVVRVTSFRESPKEMRIPKREYESGTGKSAEVGQRFTFDPAFPGEVAAVTDEHVVLRIKAKPGDEMMTPFGLGRIRDDGDRYVLAIDARVGDLIRTGGLIGYYSYVDERMIQIDYRHPFGNQKLICDVTVEKVSKQKTIVSAAEK